MASSTALQSSGKARQGMVAADNPVAGYENADAILAAEAKKRFPEIFRGILRETEEGYRKKAAEYLREIPGAYEIEEIIK